MENKDKVIKPQTWESFRNSVRGIPREQVRALETLKKYEDTDLSPTEALALKFEVARLQQELANSDVGALQVALGEAQEEAAKWKADAYKFRQEANGFREKNKAIEKKLVAAQGKKPQIDA